MANGYYNHGNLPGDNTPGSSAEIRAEFDAVTDGFTKLAPMASNANKVVTINAAETAQTVKAVDALVADTIHAATGKTTPVDADEVGIVDSAASNVLKKLTFANLWVWVQAKFAAATGKTTPVDADTIPLIDSAAASAVKTLTWANLKATLGSTFAALAGSASQVFFVGTATAEAHAPQIAQTIGKNICVNPAFQVNQLEYVSGAALASGSYGHDQWKAGTGGGDYSFTQNNASTQITIAANKTLIQAFAPENVNSTAFVVSWTGTAQCRIGVNTATPAGAYAASPVLITGQTVGSAMSIEFNAGTLGEVMVDEGAIVRARPEHRYADVLAECQRYLPAFSSESATSFISSAWAYDATTVMATVVFPERARTVPTGIAISSASHFTTVTGVTAAVPSAIALSTPSRHGALLACTVAAVTVGQGGEVYFNNASGRLFFTGCQV